MVINMSSHMRVHSTQWIIKQVELTVLVNSTRKAEEKNNYKTTEVGSKPMLPDSLLLATRQIDSLLSNLSLVPARQNGKIGVQCTGRHLRSMKTQMN